MTPPSDWVAPSGKHSSFPFPLRLALSSPPAGSQGQGSSAEPHPCDLEGCPFLLMRAAGPLIAAATLGL